LVCHACAASASVPLGGSSEGAEAMDASTRQVLFTASIRIHGCTTDRSDKNGKEESSRQQGEESRQTTRGIDCQGNKAAPDQEAAGAQGRKEGREAGNQKHQDVREKGNEENRQKGIAQSRKEGRRQNRKKPREKAIAPPITRETSAGALARSRFIAESLDAFGARPRVVAQSARDGRGTG